MKWTPFINSVLIILMIISVFASCKDIRDGAEESTSEVSAENGTITATAKKDYNGRNVTFLTVGTQERYSKEIFVEIEDTEETIYESVYRRNDAVQSHLNVTVANYPANDPYGTAMQLIGSQDLSCDIYNLPQHGCVQLLTQGYARDWNELTLQYEQPWWNPDALTNLTINGRIFMMSGSILITEIEAAVAMVYNKGIYEDYQMDYDIYRAVLEGEWTLDSYLALVSQVSEDVNKDGKYVMGEDLFGYAADPHSMAMNWPFACGLVNSSVKDGIYEAEVNVAQITDVLEKLSDMFSSDYADQSMQLVDGVMCFNNGKVFIYGLTLYNLEALRAMELDYGVIPYPKYDEQQKKYITHVGGAAPIMFIPIHNTENDSFLVDVLETMGEASHKITRPAYYEVALKEKGTRDEQSKQVLDLILNARTYDIAYISSCGVAWMVGGMVAAENAAFARQWQKQGERQLAIVQDVIDQIMDNSGY